MTLLDELEAAEEERTDLTLRITDKRLDEINDRLHAHAADLIAVARIAERLLPEEEQWDIDQDCIFCRGHYGDHYPECEWKQGRAALAPLTQEAEGEKA